MEGSIVLKLRKPLVIMSYLVSLIFAHYFFRLYYPSSHNAESEDHYN